MLQFRRLPIVALSALSLLVLLPAAASAAPTLTSVAPASIVVGSTVTATGSVSPAAAGEQVRLEQQVDGAWVQVGAVATTSATGAWTVSWSPRMGGPVRATQLTGTGGSSAELQVVVAAKVLGGARSAGALYPFLGTRATWRVAPATYPDGPVRIELSIGGRAAGSVRARIHDGVVSSKLPTNGVGRFRATLVLPDSGDLAGARGGTVSFTVRGARVGAGSNASWNRSLRAGLRFRGFFVPGGARYDGHMGDSVVAFHKAYGRPRTTTFEQSDWARLSARAVAVRDRSAGLHIEIDKGRQILMQVRGGKPIMIVHVSTGVTGNTPAGRWKVQWKGDWVPSLYGSLLYKSMSITGAYAIHGYPSVPTSAASHGCVRVPMWIAATLYRRSPVGTPIYIYERGSSTRPSVGRSSSTDVPELSGVDVAPWVDEA
ncbi:MAG: hypothetical protein JWM86_2941 [Thermoleophilia bacterium]|nr:hypothetical protein [Thermoleophilia bacterium]